MSRALNRISVPFLPYEPDQGFLLLRADQDSLVLIDELGAGTDPGEGAALGIAILNSLKRMGLLL